MVGALQRHVWLAGLALPLGLAVFGCESQGGSAASASGAAADAPSAAASVSSAPTARSVTLKLRPPAVGDQETRRKRSEDKTTVGMRGPKGGIDVATTSVALVEKTERCLEVRDGVCSKLEVSYKADSVDKTTTTTFVALDGTPDPKHQPRVKSVKQEQPNQGHTYVVTRTESAPTLVRKDGKKATKAELDSVKGGYMGSGSSERDTQKLLPPQVNVGDSLDAFAKQLSDRLIAKGDKEKPNVSASAVVKELREVDGRTLVVLEVRVTFEGKQPKLEHLKSVTIGTIEFWADSGSETKMDFASEISGTLERKSGELKGTTKETTEVLPSK